MTSASIDDKSKVSLFAVICTLPFIIGGVAWLTEIDYKASHAQAEVVELKSLTIDIRLRQIRMEQMVEDLTKKKE